MNNWKTNTHNYQKHKSIINENEPEKMSPNVRKKLNAKKNIFEGGKSCHCCLLPAVSQHRWSPSPCFTMTQVVKNQKKSTRTKTKNKKIRN